MSAVANRQGRLEKIVRTDNFGNVTKEHEKMVVRQFSNTERLQKIFYRIFSNCDKGTRENNHQIIF